MPAPWAGSIFQIGPVVFQDAAKGKRSSVLRGAVVGFSIVRRVTFRALQVTGVIGRCWIMVGVHSVKNSRGQAAALRRRTRVRRRTRAATTDSRVEPESVARAPELERGQGVHVDGGRRARGHGRGRRFWSGLSVGVGNFTKRIASKSVNVVAHGTHFTDVDGEKIFVPEDGVSNGVGIEGSGWEDGGVEAQTVEELAEGRIVLGPKLADVGVAVA